MNSIHLRSWLGLALALTALHLSAADQPIDPRCDARGTAGVCLPPNTISWLQDCPRGDGKGSCLPPGAPIVAEIECASADDGIWCEAWPQEAGNRYSYSWSVSGSLPPLVNTDVHGAWATAECSVGSGTVTVTVTAADTAPSAAVATVRCGAPPPPRGSLPF